jgi:KaiC/GvpD/RAD55 family RecA-like ATPase
MQDPTEATGTTGEAAPDAAEPEALARSLGVDPAVGRALLAAGLASADAARAASSEELRAAGLSEGDIEHLHRPPDPAEPSPETVAKWMRSVRRPERARRRTVRSPPGPKGSTDVLRKWVAGDDRALETWIQSSEGPRGTATTGAGVPAASPERPPAAPAGGAPAAPLAPAAALPANLVEREETVVHWLTDLLDRVKSDRFDPNTLVQEYQELQRSLFDEREKRRQSEEELEHVKRGSIAVIKYVRAREAKAREDLLTEKDAEIGELKSRLDALVARVSGAAPERPATPAALEGLREEMELRVRSAQAARDAEFAEREAELLRKIADLEGRLRTVRAEEEARATGPSGHGPETVERALSERERDLIRRESELRTRFEEISIRSEELERKRDAVNFKDREFADRAQELELRRQALEVEARRVEEVRAALPKGTIGPAGVPDPAQRRIAEMEQDLGRRERELQERETFLTRKLAEVESLQKQAVDREASQLHEDAVAEAKSGRIRTGVRRLDDLLFGGLPVGSQVLLNGPAHTGKDVLARLFVAEGLRNGAGALWVVTDRTYATLRDEMTTLYPAYGEAEKRGLVRYVDLYSRSLGVTEAERGVRLLASNDKAFLEQLIAAVNGFAAELKERAPTYRLVFESVSTVTAYLDSTTTFRFLQPLIGRRKLDGASGYYELETGMHTDADLQTLEHMLDGSINLKIDQLKTFLSVRGITDVQSRAWVGFTFTKRAFNLGSFSLDHIR